MAIGEMEKEEDIRNELGSLSPLILPKQTNIPAAEYFDGLPEKMIQRWNEEEKRIHQRKVLVRRWMAVAAVSLGVMIGGWWLIHTSNAPASSTAMTLSSSEAYQYVMENISDFDGLMEQQAQWPKEDKITVPDSSAAQEYLLEELQGKDIEQIF
jgi:hypothetical protein